MKNKLFTCLIVSITVVSITLLAGCGDGGTATTTSSSTSTLSLSLTDSASSGSSFSASDYSTSGVSITAVSDFSISCKDEDGTKYTATIDSSGSASVQNIPSDKKVVCYILDSSGNPVSQIFDDNTSVIGGLVDAVGISSDMSANVSLNSNINKATMTCESCTAATSASSDIDLTGTFTMSCQGVYDSATDTLDSSKSCDEDFDSGSVYLHRVQYTDTSGNTIDAYGAWPSLSAYTNCGSTEGLDNLPTGATLVTSGQNTAFSWDGGFSGFSSSDSGSTIAGYIQGSEALASTPYATFKAAQCDPNGAFMNAGSNGTGCDALYYWMQLDGDGRSGTTCLPQLTFSWGSSGLSNITARSSNGGTTSTTARFDFMNVQWYGNEMRMSSVFAEEFPAYDSTNSKSVNCKFKEDMLISFTTPGSTPATGDNVTVKFATKTDIGSIGGTSADDSICTQQLGSASGNIANGFYMLITMTKQ